LLEFNLSKLVIGVTGEISSGKGTIAEYITRRYPNTPKLRYSDSLRELYAWLQDDFVPKSGGVLPNVKATTKQLQDLSTTLRGIFGENILERAIMANVKSFFSPSHLMVIEGIRREVDIASLRQDHDIDFKLIYVDAIPEIRHRRHVARNEKTGDNLMTQGDFLHLCNAEAEDQIRDLLTSADYVLDNNGSREELESILQQVLNEWT